MHLGVSHFALLVSEWYCFFRSTIFMKHLFVIFSLLLITSVASAQPLGSRPPIPPSSHPLPLPNDLPKLKDSYPDSVAFNATFKELLPLIRPMPTIRERAQTMVSHMGNMFRSRGIDSVKAYDSVMKGIDPNMDEKILFTAYRAEFSAEELKSMIPFFKTPAGKHYLEVENHLTTARNGQIDIYISRTVNKIVVPMGKQMDMPPSLHPGGPGMGHSGIVPPPGSSTGSI